MLLGIGLVFLLFLTIALLPIWPFSRQWGYAPSAVTGVLLMGLIGLLQLGLTT
ncbi:MAG: DUF3309 family protein [Gemmatimonadota bacterium]|nr:DUF3309 family protein [Gemmatimonadota bacterium]